MGITTDDLKGTTTPAGNITKGDERSIKFRETARIDGRRPGKVYVVDSSLAHHYCDVLGVAELVDAAEGSAAPEAPPAEPPATDRAMRPPARGRRR